jgi:hypothetical protein
MLLFSNIHVLYFSYPTSTRRHGNFAGVHTLLRIILSSNSAVLINIITGVSPPHFDFCCVLCSVSMLLFTIGFSFDEANAKVRIFPAKFLQIGKFNLKYYRFCNPYLFFQEDSWTTIVNKFHINKNKNYTVCLLFWCTRYVFMIGLSKK